MAYTPRLREKYNSEIVNNLKGNFKSVMQVPKLVKISLNQGVGKNSADKKFIENAQQEMTAISGQKALITKSKKDISNFKVRKGMPVGIMVTLRGDKMYEFLDRLITSTIPRIRDFNGISTKGFDGQGNYTLGIKEQIAFSEISIDKINKVTGMDITFVTTAISDNEALDLLKEFGMPFSENGDTKREAEEAEKKKQAELKKQAEVASVEAEDSVEEDNTQEKEEATSVENIEDNNNETSANVDESENK